MNKYTPETDGVDHINVYSQGKTQLGRFLTNFANSPFICGDGEFQSVEGYWYWLSCTHPRKEELRKAYGFNAKKLGRELRAADWVHTPEFKEKIKTAIACKVGGNLRMLNELRRNTLPLRHYYVFGGKIVEDKRSQWILDFIQTLAT